MHTQKCNRTSRSSADAIPSITHSVALSLSLHSLSLSFHSLSLLLRIRSQRDCSRVSGGFGIDHALVPLPVCVRSISHSRDSSHFITRKMPASSTFFLLFPLATRRVGSLAFAFFSPDIRAHVFCFFYSMLRCFMPGFIHISFHFFWLNVDVAGLVVAAAACCRCRARIASMHNIN